MKLYFHIGTHKTGTTSFQTICNENRDLLKRHGLQYAPTGKGHNHNHWRALMQRDGFGAFRTMLEDAVSDCGPETRAVLLSSESFECCVVDTALAQQIEDAASDLGFDDITWVITHRDASELIPSLYAELSKQAGVVLNYRHLLVAAQRRGCLYVSTATLNNIYVTDFEKFRDDFRSRIRGDLIEYGHRDFVQDFPGSDLLSRILGRDIFDQLRQDLTHTERKQNTRLSEFAVELNYVTSFFNLRKGWRFRLMRLLCSVVLLPFTALRVIHVRRAHRDYFSPAHHGTAQAQQRAQIAKARV